jgi:hypothetical protein
MDNCDSDNCARLSVVCWLGCESIFAKAGGTAAPVLWNAGSTSTVWLARLLHSQYASSSIMIIASSNSNAAPALDFFSAGFGAGLGGRRAGLGDVTVTLDVVVETLGLPFVGVVVVLVETVTVSLGFLVAMFYYTMRSFK